MRTAPRAHQPPRQHLFDSCDHLRLPGLVWLHAELNAPSRLDKPESADQRDIHDACRDDAINVHVWQASVKRLSSAVDKKVTCDSI